ncbi:hypothetical protein ACF044_04485 [Microbacterium sp. NPDC016588]
MAARHERSVRHTALDELVDQIGGALEVLDGDATWVQFVFEGVLIDVNVKDGGSRVRIRAYLDFEKRAEATDEEVFSWVTRQPQPASGIVQALVDEDDDEGDVVLPRLVFERPVHSLGVDALISDIRSFTHAWELDAVAEAPAAVRDEDDPVQLAPQNGWLLMGDEESYWTAEDLQEAREEGAVGIYDSLWTAPKNGEIGDLVLLYFRAPRKAACFVARLASRPFWRTDLDVAAARPVDRHQWWAYLTPPVEIEPVPYAALREAASGHLLLRGRSGHYLTPRALEGVSITARHPHEQDFVDRIVRVPSGSPDLPDPKKMSFPQWVGLASGALSLEAKVSEYVVEPLVRFIGQAERFPAVQLSTRAEYPVGRGFVDFAFCVGDTPLIAAEIKLAIRRPTSGDWGDSPDFLQLERYMNTLASPGMLIDAHTVLVFRQGSRIPEQEFVRAQAQLDDIERLQEFVFGAAHDLFGGTGAMPTAALADAPDRLRPPDVYLVSLPVWVPPEAGARHLPVLALLARAPSTAALRAVPLIDIPVYRELATTFLQGEPCEVVANRLGCELIGPHGAATLLGGPLPEERSELLELLGDLYAPRHPRRRRVLNRG